MESGAKRMMKLSAKLLSPLAFRKMTLDLFWLERSLLLAEHRFHGSAFGKRGSLVHCGSPMPIQSQRH